MKSMTKSLSASYGLLFVWIFSFLFSLTIALFVQLIALPYWFQDLHGGNGLLIGGDWIGFNNIATKLSDSIAREGWNAWELRPERQSPAGIAAVFYFLFGAHPWTLLPMNTAVHATTAVLMVRIIQTFISDIRFALLCVLPFILFPSSLIWYSQIHKDGIFFLGVILNLYGWILLSCLKTWGVFGVKNFLPVLYIFIGCFLIWLMRPYGIKMMQGIGCIFIIMLVPYFVTQVFRRRLLFNQAFFALLIIMALPIAINIFKDGSEKGEVALVSTFTQPVENQSFVIKAKEAIVGIGWKETEWVPRILDDVFLTISIVRYGYQGSKGGSNIDADVYFRSAPEFFLYLPRAIQIGFAAPFPSFWNEQNVIGGDSTILKRIVMFEMLLVYFALFFLGYALFRWNRKIEIWLIFIFCVIFILLYTYITPNIGSLHRTRHGFLMVLLALGIAGGINFWQLKFNTLLRVSIKENGH